MTTSYNTRTWTYKMDSSVKNPLPTVMRAVNALLPNLPLRQWPAELCAINVRVRRASAWRPCAWRPLAHSPRPPAPAASAKAGQRRQVSAAAAELAKFVTRLRSDRPPAGSPSTHLVIAALKPLCSGSLGRARGGGGTLPRGLQMDKISWMVACHRGCKQVSIQAGIELGGLLSPHTELSSKAQPCWPALAPQPTAGSAAASHILAAQCSPHLLQRRSAPCAVLEVNKQADTPRPPFSAPHAPSQAAERAPPPLQRTPPPPAALPAAPGPPQGVPRPASAAHARCPAQQPAGHISQGSNQPAAQLAPAPALRGWRPGGQHLPAGVEQPLQLSEPALRGKNRPAASQGAAGSIAGSWGLCLAVGPACPRQQQSPLA